ncbi:hypothetical protein MNBD_GAMMA11-2509 [hydrothermal vent metagenome]|uniref:Uncharacterized protein n=1 Tax=hydrothermal vent metagenome TaxID=652676 RepID=A0A3B0WRD9_9ZZZZ
MLFAGLKAFSGSMLCFIKRVLNLILQPLLLLALTLFVLQGCATSAEKTAGLRQLMSQSHFEQALAEAEKQLKDDANGVMQNMNVGVLRRINGDFSASNKAFMQAKRKIDDLYATSISEQAGALMINDELIRFEGDRFEQVLIHLYMASNFLSLGDPDGARVELLQSQVRMDQWGEPDDEVPFMRYFSGIIFEILGEDDSATVSYRKAVDAYINTKARHGLNVPQSLQFDLLRMLSKMQLLNEFVEYQQRFALNNFQLPDMDNKGELIVVLGNGMSPQRAQVSIHVWSTELSANIKIAVPAYLHPPARLNKVRLQINDRYYPLEVVSNIDGLARSALSEKMPVITARALARAVVKKQSEKQAGERNGYMQLALLIFNLSTEIADTRSWSTLPQEFELARVLLPEGEHHVMIEVLGRGGRVIDTIAERVRIRAGAISVVSKRWTAPTPKLKLVPPKGNAVGDKRSVGSL